MPRRHVADTLTGILDHPVVEAALDRGAEIEPAIAETRKAWMVDLDERRPAPAYRETVNGELVHKGTDFDLFTLMNALADRRAVINLPEYDRIGAKKVKANQRVISEENRHGQVLAVIGNQKAHSFSARIKDYNVVETQPDGREEVGAPRNFALTDYTGQWNDGWGVIEFTPSRSENSFLDNNSLWDGHTLEVTNFVHPSLANAFYGSRYLATKALAGRVQDEARHYRQLAKQLRSEGIKLGGLPRLHVAEFTDKTGTRKVKVENLEARLVLPEAEGVYPVKGMTKTGDVIEYDRMPSGGKIAQDVLRYAEHRARSLSYRVGPELTAATRAVELAFHLYGFSNGEERDPGWDVATWKRDHKLPGGRIRWNRLWLNEDAALVYRTRQVPLRVASS